MSRITVKFSPVGATTPENWRETDGTTVKEFLESAQVTIRKVKVFLNGQLVEGSALNAELEDGDELKITAQNYDSGVQA